MSLLIQIGLAYLQNLGGTSTPWFRRPCVNAPTDRLHHCKVTTQCRKCHKERRVSNGTQAQKIGFLDLKIHTLSSSALMFWVCIQIEHVVQHPTYVLSYYLDETKLLINQFYLSLESSSKFPLLCHLMPHFTTFPFSNRLSWGNLIISFNDNFLNKLIPKLYQIKVSYS